MPGAVDVNRSTFSDELPIRSPRPSPGWVAVEVPAAGGCTSSALKPRVFLQSFRLFLTASYPVRWLNMSSSCTPRLERDHSMHARTMSLQRFWHSITMVRKQPLVLPTGRL